MLYFIIIKHCILLSVRACVYYLEVSSHNDIFLFIKGRSKSTDNTKKQRGNKGDTVKGHQKALQKGKYAMLYD